MVISIITFLVILSILILVHELGHFIAARRAGVWVEEFGFGLPPRFFGKKIGDTFYSLNLLPFGGFVKLHGETSDEEVTKPDMAFLNKGKFKRTVIILAGVFMNFILGILAFSFVYSFMGIPQTVETGKVKVVDVRPDSPAADSGFISGDVVVEVEGQKVTTTKEFIGVVEKGEGKEILVLLERVNVGLVEVKTTPRENPPEGEGALGVAIVSAETQFYFPPIWKRPFLGVYYGFKEAFFWSGIVISGMAKVIGQLVGGVLPEGVAGPTGLFAITSEVAKLGIFPLINWVGIISVNLAVLNVLPFPALDGGHLVFIGFEKLFGRRIVPKVQAWIHGAGLALLLLFILAITFREIRLISNLGFSGYVEYLTQGQGAK